MILDLKSRTFAWTVGAAVALAASAMFVVSGYAQNKEPIKIGFSMELTGPFAVVGKTGLLAFKIWEEEINANGALDPLPRGRRENWGGTDPSVPIL
jgi:branched-chain amino acid transport system substrate-binding protein